MLSSGAQRACRRHGIQRWPRRQLLKLSRAIDQINATGTLKNPDGTTADGEPPCMPLYAWAPPQEASPLLFMHQHSCTSLTRLVAVLPSAAEMCLCAPPHPS